MTRIEAIYKKIEGLPDFDGHVVVDSVDCRSFCGDTPLHIVSIWGDCDAIRVLVDAGADINAIGEWGFSSLHYAAQQNLPEVISLLLSLGAKILEDEDGCTPLQLATELNHKEAIHAFSQSI